MRRKIVEIDEEKCNGCGQCVTACVEGAIEIIDGKARLISDSYCDGLGACLGECPEDALIVKEREAAAFDEEAVEKRMKASQEAEQKPQFVCPGSMAREIKRPRSTPAQGAAAAVQSELTQWPLQLTLVPPDAPCFQNADILLVADCVPFAMAGFHARFLRDRSVAIGCPKLDDADFYVEKLTDILKRSTLKSLTVIHMEVPCCSGLTYIAKSALAASGKDIPLRDVTIGIDGEIQNEQ